VLIHKSSVVDVVIESTTFHPDLRGRLGFDGVGEAVAACPGLLSPGKTLGKITTANNNLALAA
jgi:hypothetical protein